MIVAYGDAVVDLFALPRGADVASAERFVPYTGGAPANVARVAARMGARARFIGAVGDDAHGDRLVAEFERDGVDVGHIVRLRQRTGVTFVRVGLDGSRSFLSYRHGGADLALSSEQLVPLLTAALGGAHWLHVTSSGLLVEPLASATLALLTAAAERHVPLSLDLNVRAHLWDDRERMVDSVRSLAARAALVKSSEEDLAAIGLAPTLEALRGLAPNAMGVVLTLAERGATARFGERELSVVAPRVDAIDSTGAGDAFHGALLASFETRGVRADALAQLPLESLREVLDVACAAGSRVVTALGATEALRATHESTR